MREREIGETEFESERKTRERFEKGYEIATQDEKCEFHEKKFQEVFLKFLKAAKEQWQQWQQRQ